MTGNDTGAAPGNTPDAAAKSASSPWLVALGVVALLFAGLMLVGVWHDPTWHAVQQWRDGTWVPRFVGVDFVLLFVLAAMLLGIGALVGILAWLVGGRFSALVAQGGRWAALGCFGFTTLMMLGT